MHFHFLNWSSLLDGTTSFISYISSLQLLVSFRHQWCVRLRTIIERWPKFSANTKRIPIKPMYNNSDNEIWSVDVPERTFVTHLGIIRMRCHFPAQCVLSIGWFFFQGVRIIWFGIDWMTEHYLIFVTIWFFNIYLVLYFAEGFHLIHNFMKESDCICFIDCITSPVGYKTYWDCWPSRDEWCQCECTRCLY